MRNMSVLELLFALLLVCLLAGVGVVAVLVWSIVRRTEGNARDVAELKARVQAGGQAHETSAAEVRERLANTQSAMEGLRAALSARQPIEEEARASLKRLEHVIAGSSSRGAAGENILEEALRHLPPAGCLDIGLRRGPDEANHLGKRKPGPLVFFDRH